MIVHMVVSYQWQEGRVRVAHLFSFLCCLIICLYFLSSLLWCTLRFSHKTMFGSSLSPVICRRAHVLHYLCLLARSVSNSYCVVLCCVVLCCVVLCCVVLCCVVLCCVVLCCVVLCCVVLCCVFVLFVFIMFAPMLPVSMDCPFLIAPSVFSNVYFRYVVILMAKRQYQGHRNDAIIELYNHKNVHGQHKPPYYCTLYLCKPVPKYIIIVVLE
jgi:hypothetical protein